MALPACSVLILTTFCCTSATATHGCVTTCDGTVNSASAIPRARLTVAGMKKIAVISVLVWTLFDGGGAAAAAGGWTWPVRGPVITPYRNGDDPYAAGQHRG